MSDVDEILRLIEEVNPSDGAALDLIDARVHCYLKRATFVSLSSIELSDQWQVQFTQHQVWYKNQGIDALSMDLGDGFPYYTRSRDALKAIRPEWAFMHKLFNGGLNDQICISDAQIDGKYFYSACLPTEELAELHAIIQAIDHDRRHNGDRPEILSISNQDGIMSKDELAAALKDFHDLQKDDEGKLCHTEKIIYEAARSWLNHLTDT